MPLANITQLEPFNINSSASFTFANIAATGNVTSTYFIGNGSQLTGISAGSTYSNANVAAYLPTFSGNSAAGNFIGNGYFLTSINASNIAGQVANALVAGTVYTNAQPNITSLGTLSSLTVSGLITATAGGIKVGNLQDTSGTNTVQLTNSDILVTGNISAGVGGTGNVTATYFIGNGSQLTGLPASYSNANVAAYLPTFTGNITAGNLSVTTALSAGTITTSGGTGNITGANNISANTFTGNLTTSAQPNITSTGTLTSLTVTNTVTSGNLSTAGTLSAGDATITGNLTVNGTTVTANVSTMNVKDPIIEMGGNVTGALTSNDGKDRGTLLHYYTTTPVDAFMGWDNSNGEFAFGSNVTVSSEVATFNTFGNVRAGNFIGAGNLTSLVVSGNITAGNLSVTSALSAGTITTSGGTGNISGANNISANTFTGTLTTQAQPNITSVGTLASLSVTANVSAGNILTNNLLYANGTPWAFSSYSNTNVGAYLPTYSGLVGGTLSTAAQPNITSVGTLASLSVTANIIAGNISGANAITSNFFVGDGSLLTGLPASYANANVATYLPTYTGNLSPGNLVVGTSANLGAIGNVTITGGTTGQVLSTDGTGNLSWTTVSAGGTTITVDTFTGNGVQVAFTLSTSPTDVNYTVATVQGVVQPRSYYTVVGTTLTFSTAPPSTTVVEVTTFASGGGGGSSTAAAVGYSLIFGG